jgi:hypothetical protein
VYTRRTLLGVPMRVTLIVKLVEILEKKGF